jgi:hypothetical protein
MSMKGNTMKILIVKAVIVLSVILLSETTVYAHEKAKPELSPLRKMQIVSLADAQITCSAVLVRAFPDEEGIVELGNEIIDKAITSLKMSIGKVAGERVIKLAKDGFKMWDESSEEGRFDLMKMCGQDILKGDAIVYEGYMPPDTQIFM